MQSKPLLSVVAGLTVVSFGCEERRGDFLLKVDFEGFCVEAGKLLEPLVLC